MKFVTRPFGGKLDDAIQILVWLQDELRRIQDALNYPTFSRGMSFAVLHEEPDKVEQGMVVYADGTNWNPGSGEGLYRHNGSAWQFVG